MPLEDVEGMVSSIYEPRTGAAGFERFRVAPACPCRGRHFANAVAVQEL